jgi:hypothetical protein
LEQVQAQVQGHRADEIQEGTAAQVLETQWTIIKAWQHLVVAVVQAGAGKRMKRRRPHRATHPTAVVWAIVNVGWLDESE